MITAILSTSVELHLGLELPVAVNTINGNVDEADFLIKNTDQILDYHTREIKIVIVDSKYDAFKIRVG